jgi:hypothetical protein
MTLSFRRHRNARPRRTRALGALALLASVSTLPAACGGSQSDVEPTEDAQAEEIEQDGASASEEGDAGEATTPSAPDDAGAPAAMNDAGRGREAGAFVDAADLADASRSTDARAPDEAGATAEAGAASSPGGMGVAPATWKEHWFEHEQTLQLVDQNEWVVLYFDDAVNRTNTTWLLPFLTRVWQYTVAQYGQFTDGRRDGRLYAIYHQGRYSGGHPSTYFDASHDHRNVSDVGPGPYPEGAWAISTHEVAHIVEGASRGVQGSPAFGIWGDSKWAEFYQYDLYVALGMSAEAKRVHDEFSRKSDSFPRAGSYWFRDWFYPLWKDHGGVRVMVDYFKLLAQHFRKNGTRFGNGMNMGEFVHFMSGAAGTNLKARATTAFGWSDSREAEFVKAQRDFPGVKY